MTEKMNKNSVKERLVYYLKTKKITQAHFCEKVGLSSGYLGAMRKSFQPNTINRIVIEFPDLNIEWLITGEGEMLRKIDGKPIESDFQESDFQHSIIRAIYAVEKIAESNRVLAESNHELTTTNKILATSNTELVQKLSELMDDIRSRRTLTAFPPLEVPKGQTASDVDAPYEKNIK